MHIRIVILLVLFSMTTWISSQESLSANEIVNQLVESMAEENIDIENSDQLQYLEYRIEQPLNLNKATKNSLEPFFFLSDIQIENILYYLYTNGSMVTIYELQAIEGLDNKTIERLLPFVTLEASEIEQPTKGIALIKYQQPIYKAKGYEPLGAYKGSNQKVFSRALIENSRLKAGVSVEKDAGEPIFSNGISTIDHTAAFVELYPKKIATQWVVGDYKLSFGEGLALSNSFTMGKSASPTNLHLRQKCLKGYASSDEYNYLRGTAANISIGKRASIVPFISLKKIYATINSDSQSITSLSTSGYHRTEAEIARRENLNETIFGTTAQLFFSKTNIQIGAYNYQLNLPNLINTELYKLHLSTNNNNSYAFATYSKYFKNAVLSGEATTNDDKEWAVCQVLAWEPDNKISISMRYQQFSLGYAAPYMTPGARYSDPSGETNIYAGFKIKHTSKLESNGYTFFYRKKWLSYQLNAPSEGYEGMWRMHFLTSSNFIHYAHIKWRHNQKNISTDTAIKGIEQTHQYNLRWQGQYKLTTNWNFTTRIEWVKFNTESLYQSSGIVFSQELGYSSSNKKWNINLQYTLFNTDNYDSRIYMYEPEVRYGFSVPSYSGQGSRTILIGHWAPINQLDLYIRFANTKFANQDQIGSGNDIIDSDNQTDIKLQLIYTFWHRKK